MYLSEAVVFTSARTLDVKWILFHWADEGGRSGPLYDKKVSRPRFCQVHPARL